MSTLNSTFGSAIAAEDLRAYVQRVYAWMVGGLLLTAGTAWMVASSPTLLAAIFGSPVYYVLLFAPIAMVWILASRVETMKPSTAAGLFVAYSIMTGMMLSILFVIYDLGSIFTTFCIAAGMFGATAIYGYVTKRDLTGMGSFLFMGLIGMIIASVVNIFLGAQPLAWAISVIGVIVFTGLTAFDMQRIKEEAAVVYEGNGMAAKYAIRSALSLYLNFINLFLSLLRLLGNRK